MRKASCILICLLLVSISCKQKPPVACSVVLRTVDAQAGTPLPITVGGPTISKDDNPWHMGVWGVGPDVSYMKVTWHAAKPLPITLESPGYEKQSLVLDEHSPKELVVRLKKTSSGNPK